MSRQHLLTFALLLLATALHAQPFLEFIGGPASVNPYRGRYEHASRYDYLAIGDTMLVASYGYDSVTYLRSTDEGATWGASHLNLPYAPNGPWEFLRATERGLLLKVRNFSSARIWTSSDGGWTWRLVRTPPINYILDVAVGENDTLFMSARSSLDGVWYLYRSTDMGETWTTLASPVVGRYVYTIAQNAGRMMALVSIPDSTGFSYGYPYISEDGGETWRKYQHRRADSVMSDVAVNSDAVIDGNGTVYLRAYRRSEVLRLRRGDTAWESAGNGLPPNTLFMALAIRPDGRLYVGTDGPGVYYSTDGGERWQETRRTTINAQVPSLGVIGDIVFANAFRQLYRLNDDDLEWYRCRTTGGPAAHSGALAASGHGDLYAGYGPGNIARSTDDGLTWIECVRVGPTNIGVQWIAVDERDRVFASAPGQNTPPGVGEGMVRSTDQGESWTKLNFGLATTGASEFAISGERMYLGTWGDGVYRSTDAGENWSRVGPGLPDNNISTMLATREGVVVVGTANSGFWRSTDHGDSWQDANDGIEHPGTLLMGENRSTGTIYVTAGMTSGSNDAHATGYRSTDQGASWSRITGITDPLPGRDSIFAVHVINGNNTGTVFALAWGEESNGTLHYWLFRSLDDGITWSVVDTMRFWPERLGFTPNDRLFVSTAHGLYRSTNTTRLSVDLGPESGGDEALSLVAMPFTSAVTITYRLPASGPVHLAIHDALGRELRTLLNADQPPGEHHLSFDADGLSSGIYYVRLQWRGRGRSAKFVVMR